MSHSIPPQGPPKATVTHERGDVKITLRVPTLTPAETLDLCLLLQRVADEASSWRHEQVMAMARTGRECDS